MRSGTPPTLGRHRETKKQELLKSIATMMGQELEFFLSASFPLPTLLIGDKEVLLPSHWVLVTLSFSLHFVNSLFAILLLIQILEVIINNFLVWPT